MLKNLSVMAIAIMGLTACGGSSNSTTTNGPDTTNPGPTNPGGTNPPVTTPDPTFADVRSAAQREMLSNHSGAVSVAIYQDGEVVFAEAYGNTQWQGNQAVSTDTLFQLGSTTKMFTSLAAMQLVDQGILTAEDTLTTTLPDIEYLAAQSQAWQNINLHHMMTHQGGFSDNYEAISDTSELIHYMLAQYGEANPLMVEPGRFFNYSNPNFSFLGAIVEYFGQQDFEDIMAQSIFKPMGMDRSTMRKSQVISDGNYALGVYQDNGQPRGYADINQVNDWKPIIPAGIYTWSTATELLKMADFLLVGNDEILDEDLRSEMTKAHVSMGQAGLPLHYGYGIFVDDGFVYKNQWYPEKLWQHGGNTEGYTSKFWILPEKNIAVAILSSGYGDNYADTMVEALKSVTELPQPEAIPVGDIDRSTFDKHVGTYDAGFMTIEISNNDGVLNVNVPELNAQGLSYSRQLEAVGANTFVANQESENVEITFFPQNEGGDSVYLRNREFVGIRIGSELMDMPDAVRELPASSQASKIILY